MPFLDVITLWRKALKTLGKIREHVHFRKCGSQCTYVQNRRFRL